MRTIGTHLGPISAIFLSVGPDLRFASPPQERNRRCPPPHWGRSGPSEWWNPPTIGDPLWNRRPCQERDPRAGTRGGRTPFLEPAPSSRTRSARRAWGVFRSRDVGRRIPTPGADRRKNQRRQSCLLIASPLEGRIYSQNRRPKVRFRGARRNCL